MIVSPYISFGVAILFIEEDIDYSRFIPEDVLKDVLMAERERASKGKKDKEKYPSSRDIVDAVVKAVSYAHGIHPDDFPDLVYSILEDQGFSTKFVTVKRIWRTYENLVRRGVIGDILGVISYVKD